MAQVGIEVKAVRDFVELKTDLRREQKRKTAQPNNEVEPWS